MVLAGGNERASVVLTWLHRSLAGDATSHATSHALAGWPGQQQRSSPLRSSPPSTAPSASCPAQPHHPAPRTHHGQRLPLFSVPADNLLDVQAVVGPGHGGAQAQAAADLGAAGSVVAQRGPHAVALHGRMGGRRARGIDRAAACNVEWCMPKHGTAPKRYTQDGRLGCKGDRARCCGRAGM